MLTGFQLYMELGGKAVLHGVDVEVRSGQVTVVLGPNGASKSVLLRALLMSDPPTRGVVTVDDREYRFPSVNNGKLPLPWPRVTAVFQQLFLYPHLRIRAQALLPFASNGGRELAEKKLEGLAVALELRDVVDRFPNEMSIGQRQRCALLRALVLSPRYLLLDEITSALDLESIDRIVEMLKRLKEDGVGVLLVTHQVGFARLVGDSVIFLDRGLVVESGNRSILSRPTTDRMRKFLSLSDTF